MSGGTGRRCAVTEQARVYVTNEMLLHDGGECVMERFARVVGQGRDPRLIIVVERDTQGDRVMVHSYADFTPDLPAGKVLRGVLRRIAREIALEIGEAHERG